MISRSAAAEDRRRASTSRDASTTIVVERLLSQDLFRTIRTDSQLAALEREVAHEHDNPYRHLLNALLGSGNKTTERAAASIWKNVLEHRRALRTRLERNISLRVAAMDWLYMQDESRRPFNAMVVSRAVLQSAIEESLHDAVTGLPSRRFFEDMLASYVSTNGRRGGTLVFVDLDGFKRANDRFGHARGDRVLRALGEVASASLRAGDLLGRVGGDEFAFLLAGVGIKVARAIVDRLRIAFEERCSSEGVSFSYGATLLRAGESAAEALKRADRAMYRSKRARASADGKGVPRPTARRSSESR